MPQFFAVDDQNNLQPKTSLIFLLDSKGYNFFNNKNFDRTHLVLPLIRNTIIPGCFWHLVIKTTQSQKHQKNNWGRSDKAKEWKPTTMPEWF